MGTTTRSVTSFRFGDGRDFVLSGEHGFDRVATAGSSHEHLMGKLKVCLRAIG